MSESRASKLAKLGYCFALAIWLASLLLPAAVVNGSMRLAGARVFMIGIDAIGSGVPGWLANPVCLGALVAGFLSRFGIATFLSGLALALSLTSFYAPAMARADGLPIADVEFKTGFFLWLAAFLLIFATSALAYCRSVRDVAGRHASSR